MAALVVVATVYNGSLYRKDWPRKRASRGRLMNHSVACRYPPTTFLSDCSLSFSLSSPSLLSRVLHTSLEFISIP